MGIKPVAAGGLCVDAVRVGEAVASVAVVGKTVFLCEGRGVVVVNPAAVRRPTEAV